MQPVLKEHLVCLLGLPEIPENKTSPSAIDLDATAKIERGGGDNLAAHTQTRVESSWRQM